MKPWSWRATIRTQVLAIRRGRILWWFGVRLILAHPAWRPLVLDRARHNSLLTIPSLVRLEGDGGHSHLYEPYNGLGSRGVLNLSNRTATALMRFPFVRLEPTLEQQNANDGEIPTDFQLKLSAAEKMIHRKAEASDWRDATYQTLQQLIVAGNVMEHLLPDNTIRIIVLDRFVVKRDHAGRLLEFVIEDLMDPASVPEEVRPFIEKNAEVAAPSGDGTGEKREIRKYTWGKLEWDNKLKRHRFHVERSTPYRPPRDRPRPHDPSPYRGRWSPPRWPIPSRPRGWVGNSSSRGRSTALR